MGAEAMNRLTAMALLMVVAMAYITTTSAQQTTPPTITNAAPYMAQEALRPVWQSIGSPAYDNPRSSPPGPRNRQSTHDLRVQKCRLLVQRLYPDSGFLPYCGFFVSEHERLGMGEEWQWSLAYSAAGISLRCHYRARNDCAGPCDRPGGSTDPQANIRAHCREWYGYYRRGIVGYSAARHVFFPPRPHDWHGGQIWRRHLKHSDVIQQAYQRGEL